MNCEGLLSKSGASLMVEDLSGGHIVRWLRTLHSGVGIVYISEFLKLSKLTPTIS